jgi:hypothetical protein
MAEWELCKHVLLAGIAVEHGAFPAPLRFIERAQAGLGFSREKTLTFEAICAGVITREFEQSAS